MTEEAVMQALLPTFEGQYMVVSVRDYGEGRAPYRYAPVMSSDLGSLRGKITNSASYNRTARNSAEYHYAIYAWDTENSEWAIIDYIPQGTHRREFSWRKGKE